MKNAYIVLGMKRSGHHAIVYWIASNLQYGSYLVNDACLGWEVGEMWPSTIQAEKSRIIPFNNNSGKLLNHIYNIEDFHPKYLGKFNFQRMSCLEKGKYDNIHIIMVLRDSYNWIASSLKTGGVAKDRIVERVETWKQEATLFLNPSLYPYVVRLNYNSWFSDRNYKQQLSSELHLQGWLKGANKVPARGNGSSFDRMKYKNNAENMDVLNRWTNYIGDSTYKRLIKDEELIHYNNAIFNFPYPEELK